VDSKLSVVSGTQDGLRDCDERFFLSYPDKSGGTFREKMLTLKNDLKRAALKAQRRKVENNALPGSGQLQTG
jgi:hypothetical protein